MVRNFNTPLVVALTVSLASCAVAQEPAADVPPPVASVTTPVPTPAPPPPSLVDLQLKADATAPVLSIVDVIALTLENNPQLGVARASLAAAQARIGVARSEGGLQVGLNGSVSEQKRYGANNNFAGAGGNAGGANNGGGFFNTGLTESLTANTNYPIYTGGRVKASTRAAEFAAQAQAAQTLQTQHDLVLTSISTYLNILRNHQLLDVAESDIAVSRERMRVAQVRYNAGAAARLEVLRANNTLAQAYQRRAVVGDTLVQYKATLNLLLKRSPEQPLRIEPITTLSSPVPLPAILSGAPAGAPGEAPTTTPEDLKTYIAILRNMTEQSRPAIQAARSQVQTAEQNVEVAKSARKPSFGLSLTGLLNNPANFLGRFVATLGLNVAQTLYDSGRTKSQITEAQALAEQAKQNLELQRTNVSGQIAQAVLNLDSANQRYASTQAAVAEAEEALRAAQLGYQAGAQTSLDVSDAQAALLQTRSDLVNARFDMASSQASLAAAVGLMTAEGRAALQKVVQDEAQRTTATTTVVNTTSETSKPAKKRRKFLGIF